VAKRISLEPGQFGAGCPHIGHVPWGDRLLVTWDGGRPVEVCPSTMEFLAELGRRDEWENTFGGLTASAS